MTLSPRERIIGGTKRLSVRHWSLMAFYRAFYYNEAPLPDIFKFWVRAIPTPTGPFASSVLGLLPEFGFPAIIENMANAEVGDEWEVQVQRIDMFSRTLSVKPIRLVQREEPLV